ncbi:MAG: YbhB/YbcL family Raf kinase inhibitor-like protein [Terriglobales bacterium]
MFGWLRKRTCRGGIFGFPRWLGVPLGALLVVTWAPAQTHPKGASAMAFAVRSTDFANGSEIPRAFTCDGEDRSPALEWSEAPAGTKTFALIADDPDAPVGTWVHWVIFNIPAGTRGLGGAVDKKEQLADGTRQGRNDFRKIGYNGPCPPPGKAHRYFFKLYALGTELTLPAGASKSELERAMEGHILDRAEWMGRYKR